VSDLTVYFIRHGDAERGAEGGDSNRSLSGRGRQITRQVAQLLSEKAEPIDQVYCSPLVRAVQTAEILIPQQDCDDAVEIQPLIAFPPSLKSVLDLVDICPTNKAGLAIVGHEPTLSGLVAHLLKSDNKMTAEGGSRWQGFYPSQIVAFTYNRNLRSWAFQWQILPDGPRLIHSIQ